ncbi:MAG: glycosyltransferase [Bacteroidota bacterium]|nr:glycosyltransferase [Bacteroidota bacterium]
MEYINLLIEKPLLLILIVFALALLVQLYYYCFYFLRIVFYKEKKLNDKKNNVSIVICARNEEENLKKNLPLILEQDYKNYEVVVVNDCSNDGTEDLLKDFKKKYNNLKITNIKEDKKFYHTKKLALTIGIKAASNEWLLLTDADCVPVSKNWISSMQNYFIDTNSIVLGYGGYKRKKGLLNNLIRFDTLFIAIQYLSFALARRPYMGVGRNLAYRKSLFFKNKGFASHYKIDSGDDDLFVNEVANKKNTLVSISIDSSTLSEPKEKFSEWFNQKKRHMRSGKAYSRKSKRRLFFEVFSRLLFYASFAFSLVFFNEYLYFILGAFFVRLVIQLIVVKRAINRLNEKNLLLSSLLYDIFLPFLNFSFFIANIFRNNKWK